jgi:hypothetical protein
MQQGGPPAAVSVCATEAPRIAAQVNRELGHGITVRRTTLRLRNPANAPDAAERRTLERLAALHGRGALPQHLLERERRPGGAVYRYYVPIRVIGLCTRCHGPAAKLAPGVPDALQKRYPGDRATGYGPGELRGMYSVTIPEAALR